MRNETHSHVTRSRDTRRTSTCELEHSHGFLRASTVRPGRFGEDPPPTPPRPAEQPGPLTYGPQGGSLGSEAGAAPGRHGEPGTQEVAREATLCGWKGDGRGRDTEECWGAGRGRGKGRNRGASNACEGGPHPTIRWRVFSTWRHRHLGTPVAEGLSCRVQGSQAPGGT